MTTDTKLVRGLSLLDSILLLAGGIIGSGVFLTARDVAVNTRTPLMFFSIWIIGLIITLLACFAFAEMGAMFPQAGGQYVYLREAYGDFVAFLYGWMVFTVSVGGTVAALAAGFALYAGEAWPAISASHPVFSVYKLTISRADLVAIAAIIVQTVVNVLGLRRGAILQNIATWAKFVAIGAFVVLGLATGRGTWSHYSSSLPAGVAPQSMLTAIGVALIAVFWAYDGWVYITWSAGEVKDPQRNLPRALILGLLIVGFVYMAVNAVYLYALPIADIAAHSTVAQTAAVSMFSPDAAMWLSLLIALSCFGAMGPCIMSGARVYYAMAEDGVFFRSLARVNPRWHTPVASLVIQGIWSAILVLSGRYDQLFTYVMFMMVLSYVLTVAGLFVLRRKMPDAPRPYRCVGYPWLPALYVLLGSAWAVNAVVEKRLETLIGTGIVLLGVPLYFYWKRGGRSQTASASGDKTIGPAGGD